MKQTDIEGKTVNFNVCVICKKEFVSKRDDAKTCSTRCRVIKHRRKTRRKKNAKAKKDTHAAKQK